MADSQVLCQPCTPFVSTAIMATTEVTTISAAAAYQAKSSDKENKRLSIGSISQGLWELAVKSAIRLTASSRNKAGGNADGEGEVVASSVLHPKALPPLPAVPPVGPGGRYRERSLSATSSSSSGSQMPLFSLLEVDSQQPVTRSQSLADLSVWVAARLKPANKFARSTHCQECNQQFSLIFRRHHCRRCQRSVCAYCSTYQRITADSQDKHPGWAETESAACKADDSDHHHEAAGKGDEEQGRESDDKDRKAAATAGQTAMHRVCRECVSQMDSKYPVICRSWTEEFTSLRQFFKQGRHVGNEQDNNHRLRPPAISRLPTECEVLARNFLQDYRQKLSKNKSVRQTTSASFNSGLQYALKPPDQKLCQVCRKVLRFSAERKTCALCDEVFCRICSSRDLVLSVPENFHPGDIYHEMVQVNVRVLSTEEAEELDKNSTGSAGSPSTSVTMQRYRVCHSCRALVVHLLNALTFNNKLTHLQAELVELQEQIMAVVDDDTRAPATCATRWPSVRSVHTYSSTEEEIVGEAVSRRVAEKLLERFFKLYLELERLQPETFTQAVLFKHVKQAMSSFYITRRSLSSKRFNKRESMLVRSSTSFAE